MDEKGKDIYIEFGKNIRKFRKARNMTIDELSEKTGIKTHYLKRIENGDARRVNTSLLFIFAEALKIKPHEIVKGL